VTGLVFTVVYVFLTPWAVAAPVTFGNEAEARYTALPVFLIEAALIVGADWLLRGRRTRGVSVVRPALAVAAVVALLAASWVVDFRYRGMRSAPTAHPWPPVVAQWHRACQASGNSEISAEVSTGYTKIPCGRLRF
jgi:hypothetical protein